MPYPSYYDPIIEDALSLAGMNRGQSNALFKGRDQAVQYNPLSPSSTYGPLNPRPVGPMQNLYADNAAKRSAYESNINGILPYFAMANERLKVRQEEDLRKYKRDYRSKLNGTNNGSGVSQTIPGTGARMTGQPTRSPSGGYNSSGGAYWGGARPMSRNNMGDPITQGIRFLSEPSFG